jgi:hypothetical protein
VVAEFFQMTREEVLALPLDEYGAMKQHINSTRRRQRGR